MHPSTRTKQKALKLKRAYTGACLSLCLQREMRDARCDIVRKVRFVCIRRAQTAPPNAIILDCLTCGVRGATRIFDLPT
jgi:hypothetical protein